MGFGGRTWGHSLDHCIDFFQLGPEDAGNHHEGHLIAKHPQSNVITILNHQSHNLDQSSDDILLQYPLVGGQEVEEACSHMELYLSKWAAIDVLFSMLEELQLLLLQ